jgi:hypothetical protein
MMLTVAADLAGVPLQMVKQQLQQLRHTPLLEQHPSWLKLPQPQPEQQLDGTGGADAASCSCGLRGAWAALLGSMARALRSCCGPAAVHADGSSCCCSRQVALCAPVLPLCRPAGGGAAGREAEAVAVQAAGRPQVDQPQEALRAAVEGAGRAEAQVLAAGGDAADSRDGVPKDNDSSTEGTSTPPAQQVDA